MAPVQFVHGKTLTGVGGSRTQSDERRKAQWDLPRSDGSVLWYGGRDRVRKGVGRTVLGRVETSTPNTEWRKLFGTFHKEDGPGSTSKRV